MKLAEKVQTWLAQSGWSQAKLAERAGVPPTTLHNWLNGTMPDLARGLALARAMGVPAQWLVDDATAEPPTIDHDRAYLEQIVARLGTRESIRRLLCEDGSDGKLTGGADLTPARPPGRRRRRA